MSAKIRTIRLTNEEYAELKELTKEVLPEDLAGMFGTKFNAFFRALGRRDPNTIKAIAEALIKYADELERKRDGHIDPER